MRAVVAMGAVLAGVFACAHAPQMTSVAEDGPVRRGKTISTGIFLDHYSVVGPRSLFVAPGVKWPLRLSDEHGNGMAGVQIKVEERFFGPTDESGLIELEPAPSWVQTPPSMLLMAPHGTSPTATVGVAALAVTAWCHTPPATTVVSNWRPRFAGQQLVLAEASIPESSQDAFIVSLYRLSESFEERFGAPPPVLTWALVERVDPRTAYLVPASSYPPLFDRAGLERSFESGISATLLNQAAASLFPVVWPDGGINALATSVGTMGNLVLGHPVPPQPVICGQLDAAVARGVTELNLLRRPGYAASETPGCVDDQALSKIAAMTWWFEAIGGDGAKVVQLLKTARQKPAKTEQEFIDLLSAELPGHPPFVYSIQRVRTVVDREGWCTRAPKSAP